MVTCSGGGTIKDVYLEQINVSNGGKSLIEDSELMLAHGRRYGVVGRNGTGVHSSPRFHLACLRLARRLR